MAKTPISEALIYTLPLTDVESEPDTPDTGHSILYQLNGISYIKDDQGNSIAIEASAGGYNPGYVQVEQQETTSTGGGTSAEGDWNVRVINAEVSDDDGLASISSNQLTLAAGLYEVAIVAMCNNVDWHQLRIYDTTGDEVLIEGLSHAAGNYPIDRAELRGRFVLTVQSVLEIQHYTATQVIDAGLGVPTYFASPERYMIAQFWRIQ